MRIKVPRLFGNNSEVGIVGEVSRRCNNRQWYIKLEAIEIQDSGTLLSASSVQAICPLNVPIL